MGPKSAGAYPSAMRGISCGRRHQRHHSRADLAGLGYSPRSVEAQLRLLRHLSTWLAARGLTAEALTEEVASAFVADRRAMTSNMRSERALLTLLGYLRALGVAAGRLPEVPATPAEALLQRFGWFLSNEKSLAPETVRRNADGGRGASPEALRTFPRFGTRSIIRRRARRRRNEPSRNARFGHGRPDAVVDCPHARGAAAMNNVRPFWIAWCCCWAAFWLIVGFFTFGLGWIGVPLSLLAILIPIGAPARPLPPPPYCLPAPRVYLQLPPPGYRQPPTGYPQQPPPGYGQRPPPGYPQLPPGGWNQRG